MRNFIKSYLPRIKKQDFQTGASEKQCREDGKNWYSDSADYQEQADLLRAKLRLKLPNPNPSFKMNQSQELTLYREWCARNHIRISNCSSTVILISYDRQGLVCLNQESESYANSNGRTSAKSELEAIKKCVQALADKHGLLSPQDVIKLKALADSK